MLTEPRLEDRVEQHYAAIATNLTQNEIGPVAGPLLGEVSRWLARRGVSPAGPPFFRYLVIDMEGKIELEAGVPVAEPVAGDERVRAGSFPPGRYATASYKGHYDGLRDATAKLLSWAEGNGISWDVRRTENGQAWGSRTEFYVTDPDEEPDPQKWETQLVFRVEQGKASPAASS